MNDWKEQLNQKEKELNLTKEVNNDVRTRSNSNVSSNRSNDSGVFVSKERRKSINTVKEGGKTAMIPSKGLFEDYTAIDKEEISAAEKVWKYIPKLIKIILNCRTNTVKIMDKLGIPRDTAEKKEETPK